MVLRSLKLDLIDVADPQQYPIPAVSKSSRVHADDSFMQEQSVFWPDTTKTATMQDVAQQIDLARVESENDDVQFWRHWNHVLAPRSGRDMPPWDCGRRKSFKRKTRTSER